MGALPVPLRAGAQLWRDRLYVDAPGWFDGPRDNGHLPVVASAVLEGRRLAIRYRRGSRSAARTLDPLGLVAKAGVWYLVAQHRGRTLSYRVSKIGAAAVLDQPAVRPQNFDLGAWWTASVAEFDRALLRFRCRVRLSPASWRRLPRVVGVEAARVDAGPPDDDGWVTVDLVLEAEDVALDQLTVLGGGVEVLGPHSLRESLRAVGESIARRNG